MNHKVVRFHTHATGQDVEATLMVTCLAVEKEIVGYLAAIVDHAHIGHVVGIPIRRRPIV